MIRSAYIGKICFGVVDTQAGRLIIRGRIENMKIRGSAIRCLFHAETGNNIFDDFYEFFDFDLYDTREEAQKHKWTLRVNKTPNEIIDGGRSRE
jgi:hypothetical protein